MPGAPFGFGARYATADTATGQGAVPAAPDPGKVSRTKELPATLSDFVRNGTSCDRDSSAEGCVLDAAQRGRLLNELSLAVGNAMDKFGAAIGDARVDLLLEKPDGPGVLVDLLLGFATGPIVTLGLRGAMNALPRLAGKLAERGWDATAMTVARAGAVVRDSKAVQDDIKSVLVEVSKQAKDKTKGVLTLGGGDRKADKLAFLLDMRDTLANTKLDVLTVAPTKLDDVGLEALNQGYQDQEIHSARAYADVVRDLLTRYDSNGIGELGRSVRQPRDLDRDWLEGNEGRLYNFGELAWAKIGSSRRLALLSGEQGKERFERFIDKDFVETAIATYTARTGHGVSRTVDIDDATARAACAWADSAWLHGIYDCQP